MTDTIEIGIPSDVDGYVLCQCPLCGGYFKLKTTDYKEASNIYCPSCGMRSSSYFTQEVIELAQVKVRNYLKEELYKGFKQLEKKTRGGMGSFKVGKRPKPEPENPIRNKIEAMEVAEFDCCNKTCKIKPLLKMTGCYCPFCGVKEYEP